MRSYFIGLSLAAWAVVCLTSGTAAAAEGYHTKLFNGQNLDGWQVTGCEAVVDDGVLLLKAGDGYVRTDETHGDFVLELDYKPRRATGYDSGIYIRAPQPAEGKPWPARYQINLKQGGEGNLLGIQGATSTGLAKPGEWNHFKITVVGDTAELEINGQKAWKASGLQGAEGYIGLQSEVDGGGQFEFKNIELTDLDYRVLFNGKDLSGWTGSTKGYDVEDGHLVCRKNGGGNLLTADEFSNFSLRFDVQFDAGGNNGVGIRTLPNGDPAYVGMEIQVLDNNAPQYAKIQPWQAHGSIYGIVAAKTGVVRPAGEWNHEEIIANGRRVTVILNGVTIVDADLDQATANGTLDGKKHPGVARTGGHIGFLGHGARVEFANIRIKELK